jgi:hypothetical protein
MNTPIITKKRVLASAGVIESASGMRKTAGDDVSGSPPTLGMARLG